jgi:hypothetical protein
MERAEGGCGCGWSVDGEMGVASTAKKGTSRGKRALGCSKYCRIAVERLRQGVLDFGSEG